MGNVLIEGPGETPYEGGFFNAILEFPEDFPQKPPVMKFTTPNFWHPNVYKDGKVCISILHEPKEDPFNLQESVDLKWRPILSVEAVIVSVISMLNSPNFGSPANRCVGGVEEEPRGVREEDQEARAQNTGHDVWRMRTRLCPQCLQ